MMDSMSTRGPDSAGFAIYSTERKKKYKSSNEIISKHIIKFNKNDN